MDLFLTRKGAPKRRTSLSLLFGSQKPTLASRNDEATRYYDFVDTPAISKPSSPPVDRQDISSELELKIRYACSLLAYRIERGVPSLPYNHVSRPTTQERPIQDITAKSQLESRYPSSELRSKVYTTGYDSGVGLTQQPSMQTMTALDSRSRDLSSDGDTRTVSIFSDPRTGTSYSDTSAINSTALSCAQSSTQSPKQNETQSMTGRDVVEYAQQHNTDTRAFLSGPTPQPTTKEDNTPSDIEAFLIPSTTTNLSCETLQTNPSPSLGLSRVHAFNQHSELDDDLPHQPESESTSDIATEPNHKSIIIDSHGCARLLTPDEESQRNKALQQAVIAKMKMRPGFMKYSPVREPSRLGKRLPSVQDSLGNDDNSNNNLQARSESRASQLGFSWFVKGEGNNDPVLRKKGRGVQAKGFYQGNGASVLERLSRFFCSRAA
ncbi:hypothetical protein BDW59DRAFT_164567 [Aspergillus cavernicola]|uniref:Uncharacterized protein n=1 Tax=Aspergillus cavernicola TaxID=176166 RepID=A0ABR4HYG1_9EURO